jgi:hypothetical protein
VSEGLGDCGVRKDSLSWRGGETAWSGAVAWRVRPTRYAFESPDSARGFEAVGGRGVMSDE